jgi:hypothetical protein
MKRSEIDDAIEILACDIDSRPRGAPGIGALAGWVTDVARGDGVLVVTFADAAEDALQAFVEAERTCCGDIGWEVVSVPTPTLRITSGEAQLDVLAGAFAPTQ